MLKLGIVHSMNATSFSSVAYSGVLSENAEKIKAIGYDGIELAVRDPDQLDIQKIHSILADLGLEVPAIGTGQAFIEDGLSFTDPDPGIRQRAVDRIKAHMEMAEAFGAIVIIGLIRGGKLKNVEHDRAEDWLLHALADCCMTNRACKLAIEPINRYECDLVQTVSEGLDLVERVGMENIGLLLDTFHMNIEEPSLTDSIRNARSNLIHFHVADSNRWYPGAGHLDFSRIITTLTEIGYSGYISAEIQPLPDPDQASKRAYETLHKFIL